MRRLREERRRERHLAVRLARAAKVRWQTRHLRAVPEPAMVPYFAR